MLSDDISNLHEGADSEIQMYSENQGGSSYRALPTDLRQHLNRSSYWVEKQEIILSPDSLQIHTLVWLFSDML